MPYSSNSELPQAVRDRYSEHCQGVFRNTFNSVLSSHGDESRAFASAHASAKRCEGSKSMSGTDFKIFTDLLKAYEVDGPDGTKKKRLRTTASSSVKDLVGDEITPVAIEKMAASARENMTIFLNHSYNVPEDVLGSVEDAQVIQRGADEEGNPIIDLDLDVGLNEANPRAVQAWSAIQNGTKLGCSVGAKVRHATKRKGGGLIIDDIHLLEASIVGIPANQRSWVHYAVKSLSTSPESETVIEDEAIIEDEITEENVDAVVLSQGNPAETYTTSGDPDTIFTISSITVKEDDEMVTETPEPDKEAARTRVTVTIDSEAQEAPSRSHPGNAREQVADETAAGDDEALGDNVTRAEEIVPNAELTIQESVSTLEEKIAAVGEIISLRKQVSDLTRERNEALANLAFAKELIEKVGDLPLARKAKPTVEMLASATRRWENIYDPEVVKLLGRK